MRTLIQFLSLLTVLLLTTPNSLLADGEQDIEKKLHDEVVEALKRFESKDTTFKATLNKAQGYVVYPSIAKGGLIVGAASGRGEVYQKGKLVGRASLSQGSIGAQIGGQVFSEVILFETESAFDRFKSSELKMNAQVTAVAASEGVAERAKFADGVAVITMVKSGLMAEASVGGQKLTFIPLTKEEKP